MKTLFRVFLVSFVYLYGISVNSQSSKLVRSSTGEVQKELPSDPRQVEPLKVGQKAPEVSVQDLTGKALPLMRILEKKPTFLVFYRGGWCPYCNVQLEALGKVETKVLSKGYQIVGLSADQPKKIRETLKKKELSYALYSDRTMEAAQAFGTAFRLIPEELDRLKTHKIDVESASGERHHILPVPSLYVLDTKGNVLYQYSNPDYKNRLEMGDLLAVLDRVEKEKKLK